jgi:hypothetical protein
MVSEHVFLDVLGGKPFHGSADLEVDPHRSTHAVRNHPVLEVATLAAAGIPGAAIADDGAVAMTWSRLSVDVAERLTADLAQRCGYAVFGDVGRE